MVRLNKFLADAGVCSRREGDKLIDRGVVTIDGEIATPGTKVEKGQVVKVRGKKVGNEKKETIVLLVNKPRGIVCTEDPKEAKNIIKFLNYPERITYAGRLDKDSQGLLVMTNDGDLIQKMMKSTHGHEKEYQVTLDKKVTGGLLRAMKAGVRITKEEKGEIVMDEVTRPCKVKQTGERTFSIILTQGLNRQIRRMCEALGFQVKILERNRIMNLELGKLKPGTYRTATPREIKELRKMLNGDK